MSAGAMVDSDTFKLAQTEKGMIMQEVAEPTNVYANRLAERVEIESYQLSEADQHILDAIEWLKIQEKDRGGLQLIIAMLYQQNSRGGLICEIDTDNVQFLQIGPRPTLLKNWRQSRTSLDKESDTI